MEDATEISSPHVSACKQRGQAGLVSGQNVGGESTPRSGCDPEGIDPESTDPESTDPESTDPESTDGESTDGGTPPALRVGLDAFCSHSDLSWHEPLGHWFLRSSGSLPVYTFTMTATTQAMMTSMVCVCVVQKAVGGLNDMVLGVPLMVFYFIWLGNQRRVTEQLEEIHFCNFCSTAVLCCKSRRKNSLALLIPYSRNQVTEVSDFKSFV